MPISDNQDLAAYVQDLCRQFQLTPQRSKGQHFLTSRAVLNDSLAAAALSVTDTVLEVGPGLGILTEALVQRAGRVISVELDKKLFTFLQQQFGGVKNLTLMNQDILQFDPAQLAVGNYRVVANLPYNITSRFLQNFLTKTPKPQSMVLLIQKEVAERVCAPAGKMSLLSLSVQLYGVPQVVRIVKRDNFWPSPQVDSALIKIDEIKSAIAVQRWLGAVSEQEFWRVARIGFSARRKQLHNNLSSGLRISNQIAEQLLAAAKITPDARAQSLNLDQWRQLAKNAKNYLK